MKAFLILENGYVFEGGHIGAVKDAVSEVVFTTGMTGYTETLTDPSYAGQSIVMTYPLIGNYGVCKRDMESDRIWASGYIVREACRRGSNFRSGGEIEDFLKEHQIPGICGIDTRALTKILRESGTMNGLITTDEHFDKDAVIARLKQYTVSGVVKRVSRKEKVIYKNAAFEPTDLEQAQMGVLADASMLVAIAEAGLTGVSNGLIAMYADQGASGAEKLAQLTAEKRTADQNGTVIRTKHIALLDYGAKSSIIHCLGRRGCDVTVYPCDTPAQTIIDDRPDGIMLSNGPGDPAECVEIIEQIKALCASGIPIFAICLGHQLLALAHGFETAKLKYGHRGANHPVKDIRTGRVYMSSQNHGYVVVPESVDPKVAEVTFVNANDGTVEGIAYKNARITSVQFHPEASGGPKDTEFLFDAFLES